MANKLNKMSNYAMWGSFAVIERYQWLRSHQYLYFFSIFRQHVIQICTTCKYFTCSLIWLMVQYMVRWLIFCLFLRFVFTENCFSWSWTNHICATTNCWDWRRVWLRQTLYIVWGNSTVHYSTSKHCGQHCGFAVIILYIRGFGVISKPKNHLTVT